MRMLLVALLFVACAPSETLPDCTPGATVACACVGGASGAQTCTDGRTYGTCVCPDGGATDVFGLEVAVDVAPIDTPPVDVAALDAGPDTSSQDAALEAAVATDSGRDDAGDGTGDSIADIGADSMTDTGADVPADTAADAGALTPISVAAGYSFACVLMSDRSVWCRGANDRGQLGQGDRDFHHGLVRVPLADRATQIVAHEYSACAVLESGTSRCWGEVLGGPLPGSLPSDPGLGRVARMDLGAIVCGIPTVPGAVTCPREGMLVTPFPSIMADQLNVAGVEVCALGVGTRELVQCGAIGNRGDVVRRTVMAPTGRTWTSIVASRAISGGNFWCATADDQSLWCWGRSSLSLGDGVTTNSLVPVQILGPSSASQVSCSGTHCLARTPTGSVYFWGTDGPRVERRAILIPGIGDVRSVSASNNNSCLMYANRTECRGIESRPDAFLML